MVQKSSKGSKALSRRKETKKLNSWPIPDRKFKKRIEPELWYIIWEQNLLKPKILTYNFIDEYHAKKFALEYLEGYKYNVLQGGVLISFGIFGVDYRLSQVVDRKKGSQYRYGFDSQLSSQRKKALRTAYRRTFRRRLRKLLKIKKTMNKVPVTLDKINEKPGIFFKRLLKFYQYELTYSITFPAWYINEEGWRIDEIKAYAKDVPTVVTDVVNIVQTLEESYNENNYDYKNDTYVSTAIKLHKKYRVRIEKYMKKKLSIGRVKQPTHTNIEAWRELIARGFVDNTFIGFLPKKDIYVRGNIGNLVWNQTFKTQTEAYPILVGYGVKGFTGINIVEK